ncbi:Rhodanese-like domain-containing protein [Glomus cerebriforme]|uniref:Sulfurtransferase n=1 Tax=Glomus cerebriforme TaxID=658196 RepID=A0A397T324_9GLOM|nr:Rhodanese-like domain-containing protein [Glomus cerebriforme]
MANRIFDKILLLLIRNRFRTTSNILLPFIYNLKSSYFFQNKGLNNKSYNAISINVINNVSHLRYYSSSSNSNDVSFDELQQLLKEKNEGKQKDVRIIDVREPFELIDGHIPHAINIPLNQFEEAMTLSEEDFNIIYGLPKFKKDDKIILYCKSGQRSMVAATVAKHFGFTEARNYPGSWLEYYEKNR